MNKATSYGTIKRKLKKIEQELNDEYEISESPAIATALQELLDIKYRLDEIEESQNE